MNTADTISRLKEALTTLETPLPMLLHDKRQTAYVLCATLARRAAHTQLQARMAALTAGKPDPLAAIVAPPEPG